MLNIWQLRLMFPGKLYYFLRKLYAAPVHSLLTCPCHSKLLDCKTGLDQHSVNGQFSQGTAILFFKMKWLDFAQDHRTAIQARVGRFLVSFSCVDTQVSSSIVNVQYPVA